MGDSQKGMCKSSWGMTVSATASIAGSILMKLLPAIYQTLDPDASWLWQVGLSLGQDGPQAKTPGPHSVERISDWTFANCTRIRDDH